MFHKLHLQLTIFFTLVTGSIFLILTGICLFFAGKNICQSQSASFLTEITSTISHLQEQDAISHKWLNQLQENGHIRLYLYDNQMPLFYQQYHTSGQEQALTEEIILSAKEKHGMDLFAPSNQTITAHTEFDFRSSSGDDYYVSVGTIPKSGGHLGFILLYPPTEQQAQLLHLRLVVIAADCCAILLLAVFSWHFTKKMIVPLSEAQKKQTRFIASASHELRSPLAVLRSGLEVISKTTSPTEQEHYIRLMSSEITRMQSLIEDMLLLANSDSKSLPMHKKNCQPDTLLLDAFEKFEPLARKKGIRLSIALPKELLPDCPCDPGRIGQVFSILIDNALSYTPKGGSVTLSLKYTDKIFAFSISDTGCGIPDSEKPLIFERFYRADQAHADKEHFGLGLCIAKEIVEKHAGTIRVEDCPGGGSCFTVRLPNHISA